MDRRWVVVIVVVVIGAWIWNNHQHNDEPHYSQTPAEWMDVARQTVNTICTEEADDSGATGEVWQNVYGRSSSCSSRSDVVQRLGPTISLSHPMRTVHLAPN